MKMSNIIINISHFPIHKTFRLSPRVNQIQMENVAINVFIKLMLILADILLVRAKPLNADDLRTNIESSA